MAPLDKSTSEADVIFELMVKDFKIGRRGLNEGVIGKMLEVDDDESQDMMRRLRSSIQVSVGQIPNQHLKDSRGCCTNAHKERRLCKQRRRDSENSNDGDRRKLRER